MNKELALLDQIEEIRQRVAEHPENFPVDYTIRLISAYVAQNAGYSNRNNWTDELKKHSDSKYSTRLKENRFHI